MTPGYLALSDSEKALSLAKEGLRGIVANRYIPQTFRRAACRELLDFLQSLTNAIEDETVDLPDRLPPVIKEFTLL